jgi:fatty acid desaturase
MPLPSATGFRNEYGLLADRIREATLLRRRPAYYVATMSLTIAAFAGGWVALSAVGDSWASLCIAGLLAFLSAQVAFFAHDAGHQQIFASRRANRMVGLVAANVLTGLSFGWWVPKHNAHHAHPNVIGRDPDIGVGTVALAFTADTVRNRKGAGRVLARYQAWVFFPLLLLEGVGLRLSGVDNLLRRRDRSAAVEGMLLGMHAVLYLTAVFWVLSPLRAVTFVAVQQGLFGLYLGCSFAPNHKGMPVLADDSDLGFVRRQVITSRNVTGAPLIGFLFGGLNYQIEHHLFPAMPRPNLPRARAIIQMFCADHDIAYHESNLFGSYRQALSYLNMVGAV